jgi:hypothetical protein
MQNTLSLHPAHDLKNFSLQGMVIPQYRHLGRKILEVGSM